MALHTRPLAFVTGADAGIGFDLARQCARQGYDLIVTSADPGIHSAAHALRSMGARVNPVQADLGTSEGIEAVHAAAGGRAADILVATGDYNLDQGFLSRDDHQLRRELDRHVAGTIGLLQKVARHMCVAGQGRIFIVGSIATLLLPFAMDIQPELDEAGITITCQASGAAVAATLDAALAGKKTA